MNPALIEERLESSDARAPDNAHLLLVDGFEVETRILHGLRGGNEGILREEVVLADLLAVEMLARIVILYFTSELCLKFPGIEMSNGCGTADSLLKICKIFFDIVTKRVDRTDARDYYSSSCHKIQGKISCENFF